jgi:hypothetical protein
VPAPFVLDWLEGPRRPRDGSVLLEQLADGRAPRSAGEVDQNLLVLLGDRVGRREEPEVQPTTSIVADREQPRVRLARVEVDKWDGRAIYGEP